MTDSGHRTKRPPATLGRRQTPPPDQTAAGHVREVVRGASVAFVLKVLGAALSFGLNVAVARALGVDGAGVYFLAVAIATIASLVGRAGLDNTLLRLTASAAAKKDWSGTRHLHRQALLVTYTAAGCIAGALFLWAPSIARAVLGKPELGTPLRIMALSIVPTAALMLRAELLRALERIRDSQILNSIVVPGISLLLVYPLSRWHGASGATFAYVIASATASAAAYALWRRAVPPAGPCADGLSIRELLRLNLPLFWVAILGMLDARASTVLLGAWSPTSEVALFAAAQRTALLTAFILVSVNSISAPKFSALHDRGDLAALAAVAKRSTQMMTLLSLPMLAIFFFFPSWVMALFGAGFDAAALPLRILAAGQFVNVATGSVSLLLMMTGHARAARNNAVFGTITNVALNCALIPLLGALGAAIATSASLVIKNLAAAFLVKRHLGIDLLIRMPRRRGRSSLDVTEHRDR